MVLSVPDDRMYAKTHEWILIEGDIATIGLTDFAQNELGDITYLELPEAGDTLGLSDSFGVVESVKAASDVYAPVSGEVVESNGQAEDAPELVNQAPFTDAWLIKIRMDDPSQADDLLDAAAYQAFIDEGGH